MRWIAAVLACCTAVALSACPDDTSAPLDGATAETDTGAADGDVHETSDTPDGDADASDPLPVGTNHPCEPSPGEPGSADPAVTACVCATDAFCCETGWDGVCTSIAASDCGVACDCATAPPADLACQTDADCSWCGDGDLCAGSWTCEANVCALTGVVTCDPSVNTECNLNTCDPTTGACALVPSPAACDDADPCTADTCGASGACVHAPIEGACENHPCLTSDFPGSNDPAVTACVCAQDNFCCTGIWDSVCSDLAVTMCGQTCNCAAAPPDELGCESDADCEFCGGDLCAGGFTCVDSVCTAITDVVCDPSGDTECLINTCDPATGACAPKLDDSACADDDPCTLDGCTPDGACTNEPNPACDNHPCEQSPVGTSNDEAVTTCVCAEDSFCCDKKWDAFCVGLAQSACGVVCDCEAAGADLSCEDDGDCSWCGGDACQGWACVGSVCQPQALVTCDPSGDTECNLNTCDPATGECALGPTPSACDDDDPCTADACDDQGACAHEAIPGCAGTPPFVCLGPEEPSASGCNVVAIAEGCCDPWGRVTWCEGGETFCIDCAGSNPVCGWSSEGGYYDCGADDYTPDPSGSAALQCPGYTYAD